MWMRMASAFLWRTPTLSRADAVRVGDLRRCVEAADALPLALHLEDGLACVAAGADVAAEQARLPAVLHAAVVAPSHQVAVALRREFVAVALPTGPRRKHAMGRLVGRVARPAPRAGALLRRRQWKCTRRDMSVTNMRREVLRRAESRTSSLFDVTALALCLADPQRGWK